jgi:hypothetical protein
MGLPKFNPLDVKLKPTARVPPPAIKDEPPRIRPELKKTVLPPKNQQTKPPAAPPPQEQPVERAKVIFQYKSEQEDELDINVGDVLEVVNKTEHDGWWKVKLGGRVGVVPDNFVELLPLEQLPAPDLPHAKKEPRRPPPPPAQDTPEHPPDKPADFGVPLTEPLDSSAVKERPHRPGGVRPPSRSNLHQEDGELASSQGGGGAGDEAPWQREIKQRKKKEPVKLPPSKPHPPPPATVATEPEKPAPPRMASKPSLAAKPKPPPAKPPVDIAKTKPPPAKPPSEATPPPGAETTPPKSSEEWIEALDKLRSEFNEFKTQIRKELREEIKTLSDDLDQERKNNASLRIDIDRLKKMKL